VLCNVCERYTDICAVDEHEKPTVLRFVPSLPETIKWHSLVLGLHAFGSKFSRTEAGIRATKHGMLAKVAVSQGGGRQNLTGMPLQLT
jgi:hypothetical protein